MALNQLGMGVIFTASDLASNVIQGFVRNLGVMDEAATKASAVLGQFAKSTVNLGPSLKKLAIGAGLATAGFLGLKTAFAPAVAAASEFEAIMLRVQQKTKFTDEQIAQLGEDFLKLSAALPLSAAELAKVGVIAGQLGIKSAEGVKALAFQSAQLARVSGMVEEASAAALARMSKLFGVSIDQANKLGSSLEVMASASTAAHDQIIDITIRMAGMAKQLGVTAAESQAFAATLVDAGLRTEEAGSAMSKILGAVTIKTEKFAKVIGVSEPQFKQMFGEAPTKTLVKFFEAFRGIDKWQVVKKLKEMGLGGLRTAKAVQGLARLSGDLTKNLELANKEYERGLALQEAFEKQTRGLRAAWDTLTGSLKNVAIVAGKIIVPALTEIVQLGSEMVSWIFEVPKVVRQFIVWGAALTGIAMVVGGLVLALKGLIGLAVAFGPVVIAALSPFLILGAKILAVSALIFAAWKTNFGGFKDVVVAIWEFTKSSFIPIWDEVKSSFVEIGMLFSEAFGPILNWFGAGGQSTLKGFVKVIVGALLGPFALVAKVIAWIVRGVVGLIRGLTWLGRVAVSVVWPFLRLVWRIADGIFGIRKMAERVGSFMEGLWDEIVEGWTVIWDRWGKHFKAMWKDMAKTARETWSELKRTIFDSLNLMIDATNKVIELRLAIFKWMAPKRLATMLEVAGPFFKIPHLRPGAVEGAFGKLPGFAPGGGPAGEQAALTGAGTAAAVPAAAVPAAAAGGGGISRAELRLLFQEGVRAGVISERGRPIRVEGRVELDRESVGRMEARQRRDAIRTGGRTPPVHGED